MANMTPTTQAVFIPEVWSKKVLKAVEDRLVVAGLVTRLDGDVKGRGDIIHIPNVSNLVANAKVSGSEIQLQAPTETSVPLAIDQYVESSFLVENITKTQSQYDLMSLYTDKAGYAIAEAIDTTLTALASGFSQTKGTFNTAITTDVLLDSIELLDLANVPQDDRHFVYRPDVKRDLLDLSTYTSGDFVNGRPVETGNIGMVYGVKTYMSNNVLKSGDNTSNMLFHREAMALAMQTQPNAESEYSIRDKGTIVSVDALYGAIELRDTFGVLVKT
jgi:N4-gp56 family major capsid protein